jgi:hypothetical protein
MDCLTIRRVAGDAQIPTVPHAAGQPLLGRPGWNPGYRSHRHGDRRATKPNNHLNNGDTQTTSLQSRRTQSDNEPHTEPDATEIST